MEPLVSAVQSLDIVSLLGMSTSDRALMGLASPALAARGSPAPCVRSGMGEAGSGKEPPSAFSFHPRPVAGTDGIPLRPKPRVISAGRLTLVRPTLSKRFANRSR